MTTCKGWRLTRWRLTEVSARRQVVALMYTLHNLKERHYSAPNERAKVMQNCSRSWDYARDHKRPNQRTVLFTNNVGYGRTLTTEVIVRPLNTGYEFSNAAFRYCALLGKSC